MTESRQSNIEMGEPRSIWALRPDLELIRVTVWKGPFFLFAKFYPGRRVAWQVLG